MGNNVIDLLYARLACLSQCRLVQICAFILVRVYRSTYVFGETPVDVNVDGMKGNSSLAFRYTKSFGS